MKQSAEKIGAILKEMPALNWNRKSFHTCKLNLDRLQSYYYICLFTAAYQMALFQIQLPVFNCISCSFHPWHDAPVIHSIKCVGLLNPSCITINLCVSQSSSHVLFDPHTNCSVFYQRHFRTVIRSKWTVFWYPSVAQFEIYPSDSSLFPGLSSRLITIRHKMKSAS